MSRWMGCTSDLDGADGGDAVSPNERANEASGATPWGGGDTSVGGKSIAPHRI